MHILSSILFLRIFSFAVYLSIFFKHSATGNQTQNQFHQFNCTLLLIKSYALVLFLLKHKKILRKLQNLIFVFSQLQEITTFKQKELRSQPMAERQVLPSKEDIQREKVKVEISLFKQWWLKNVDIHDKSNPNFTPNVLKVVHDEIRKYDSDMSCKIA